MSFIKFVFLIYQKYKLKMEEKNETQKKT